MLYSISVDQISATRDAMRNAVEARMSAERAAGTLNPAKERFLSAFRNRVARLDSFSLAYLGTHPVAFDTVFLSHKRNGAMFNIYAMTKACEIARVLNGGALDSKAGGDHMTIAGVALAIERGDTVEKTIAHKLNDYARASGRRDYSSGATQASSSLRALEAFGIVKMTGRAGQCAMWEVANRDTFARVCDAARGISAHGMGSDTRENADSMSSEGRDALRSETATEIPVSAPAKGSKRARKGKTATPASAPESGTEWDAIISPDMLEEGTLAHVDALLGALGVDSLPPVTAF